MDERWQITPWCVFRTGAVIAWLIALLCVALDLANVADLNALLILATGVASTLTIAAFASLQLPRIARRIAASLDAAQQQRITPIR